MGKPRTRRLKPADPAPERAEPLTLEAFDPGRAEDALETLRRQTKMMQVKLRVLETATSGGVVPLRTGDDGEARRVVEQERAALEAEKAEVERRVADAEDRDRRANEQLERARERETAALAQAEAYAKELARLRELIDELEARELDRSARSIEDALTKLTGVVASLQSDERTRIELAQSATAQAEAHENELSRLRALVNDLDEHYRAAVDSTLDAELDRSAHAVDAAVAKLTAFATSLKADEASRIALAQRETELVARAAEIAEAKAQLERAHLAVDERTAALDEDRAVVESLERELAARAEQLAQRERDVNGKASSLEQRESEAESLERELAQRTEDLEQRERENEVEASALEQRERELVALQNGVERASAALAAERTSFEQERKRVAAEASDLANDRSQLERRQKELDRERRELAKQAEELTKRHRKLDSLGDKARSLESQAKALAEERDALAAQTRKVFEREQNVKALEGRERALLTAAADLKQREEAFAVRVRELERREAEHARERDELAKRIAMLASELQPQQAEREVQHAEQRGAPEQAEPTPRTVASEWSIDELERLVDARSDAFPERADEWRYTLFYLRPLAGADGVLPPNLAGVVQETFGDLISG